MNDGSFTSMLILLALFIILPSVLKLIGKFTAGGRNVDAKSDEGEMPGMEQGAEHYPGDTSYRADAEYHDRTPVSNKPIRPRWF